MSEKNKEKALEVVKDGLVDLSNAVEALEIPGVATMYSFATLIAHNREVRKFEAFLDRIRTRLDLDRVQLLREMRDNQHKKWMAEGLARGWRMSLDAMDETARECCYLMVADYLALKKDPDRDHRLLGNLFMDSDLEMLNQYAQVSEALKSHGYIESRVVLTRSDPPQPEGTDKIMLYSGTDRMSALSPLKIEESTDALVRNGLASFPRGGTPLPVDGPYRDIQRTFCVINAYHMPLWKSLFAYLKPVRTVRHTT
jgi:hypothetical protein